MARYFEVWVDQTKKAEVIKKLKEICEEVHEVFYDYDVIVRVSEMEEKDLLKIDGVKRVRRHYNC
uniref:Uncharacterized protein n=1 Tax=Archaeoglobus fulgidus TaxID=2234 RepID=A0A7C3M9F2_ARCFL